mmetsp:Transcript_83130/g.164944  ORF Transcript_83130/g.164944 Transcript_83130/m.164944 type:complete len:202 (+) Transcript_83130:66-671(+)|eukprot:CAMPEP_0172719390 /NCGR_PEP_ID=MMETSP1074-20121228/75476_1 /TAXON_ID=2916 /ORGANISM="Ceratium fusus, Strain PA161109" /LENGTH=201 /DNA_ID=CAMNT_0013544737 /DNA_START=66 /DNA_END=671 /DNA_ORIENTATION=+
MASTGVSRLLKQSVSQASGAWRHQAVLQSRCFFGVPGMPLPNIALHKGFPPEKIMMGDYCKGKKVVFVGLPGAFTPTCSNKQIPGYLAKEAELKAKVVSDVIVFAVHDGAVMKGWSEAQKIEEGSIMQLMGDPKGELTKALRVQLDDPRVMEVLGNVRCKRMSMLVDDGVIKTINVAASEDDPAGNDHPEVSLVEKMLEDL